MIAYIEGLLLAAEPHALVIQVGGIGYRVATTEAAIQAATLSGGRSALWTHLVVRENALDLYGFPVREELDFFTLLLSVSGIGPKSALAIVNLAPVGILARAIAQGDSSYLTKVAGIGRKNAQKIVLELKDKVGALSSSGTPLPNSEALDALTTLGIPLTEAREALKRITPNITTIEEQITFVLRELGSSR
jgi:holliday junction DNA helicase RuvA